MTHNRGAFYTIVVLLSLVILVHCKPVQKPNDSEKKKDEWRKEEDPAYVKYLKQVIEILEEDENFSKRLENVTEEDIRSGKIAEEIDFASHHIRTKLDELKRKEIESQRQLLRKQEDVRRGIHREYWNPLNDRENPNTFEVGDLKKLLAKHHEEMNEIDKRRKDEFRRHEMDKEHKRRVSEKGLDEEKKKEAAEERRRLREKHIRDAQRVNHPGSKQQLEEVWEEEDGFDKDQFNPRTFFKMHDKDNDGQLDPYELESLFYREASKIHNSTDPDFDRRALDEEVQRMREHVVKEVDKDNDGFVSYDEFIGATKDPEYEKPPEENWKPIDDEKEFTDEEFEEYEKEFDDDEDDEEENHNEVPAGATVTQQDAAAPHVPLAHSPEQEKREHGGENTQ
ncbi:nucleobindin-2-like [Dendronephthya gigantea]|uniref:nucleobindin-2-like n=1 Tax=Dendronephthya gigantea TaxID=151771 RepID=UPI00106CC9B2|nr:nucleobindin-2-like [Dendronephthya gigantea]